MDEQYVQALYAVFGLYSLLLCIAAGFDVYKFVIPNLITVALVVLFVGIALYLPFEINWLSHLGAAAVVFAVGAAMFAMKKLGGGDVKLLTAVAFWAGFDHLADLMLYVTLAGGGLAVALMILRQVLMGVRVAQSRLGKYALPRVLLPGEPMPYALAIAPSAIYAGTKMPYLGEFLWI